MGQEIERRTFFALMGAAIATPQTASAGIPGVPKGAGTAMTAQDPRTGKSLIIGFWPGGSVFNLTTGGQELFQYIFEESEKRRKAEEAKITARA